MNPLRIGEARWLYQREGLTIRQVAQRLKVRSSRVSEALRGYERGMSGVTSKTREKKLPAPPPVPSDLMLHDPLEADRMLFRAIIGRVGIAQAIDWMAELTRERGRTLRDAATRMEIVSEQIAQALERTRASL